MFYPVFKIIIVSRGTVNTRFRGIRKKIPCLFGSNTKLSF